MHSGEIAKPFLLEDCFHTYVRYGVHFDMVFWGIY